MKLYLVYVMDDCEIEAIPIVARCEEEAVEKVSNMEWACLMDVTAFELDKVGGYKINLVKIEEENT